MVYAIATLFLIIKLIIVNTAITYNRPTSPTSFYGSAHRFPIPAHWDGRAHAPPLAPPLLAGRRPAVA